MRVAVCGDPGLASGSTKLRDYMMLEETVRRR
jgi:hypothetical protein